jgi:uncharacterized membrane protein
MVLQVCGALFLLLCGALAGVLIAVEVAVVPMMAALPGDRWVQVHRLLDPGFDPLMPNVNKVTLALGVVLAIFVDGAWAQIAFAVAVLSIIAVAVVSEKYNVRMNRDIDEWEVDRLPEGWAALRAAWARWNRVRTAISLVGFAAAIAAAMAAWI